MVVSGGNVGIGTDSPSRTLSVSSSANRVALFNGANPSNVSDVAIANSQSGGLIGYHGGSFVVSTGGAANTGTGGVDSLTIDASGNATFSGMVSANGIDAGLNGQVLTFDAGSPSRDCGLRFAAINGVPTIRPFSFVNNDVSSGTVDLGNSSSKFKDAYFSGTVDAAGFTVNGQPIGGGLPDGDFTHNGKITATDFIDTSDERLKDNITTALWDS